MATCPLSLRGKRRWLAGLLAVMLLSGVTACGASTTASSPTATATSAAPTATATPTVLFQNALASPVSGWGNDPSLGCFFGSGGYHVKDTDCPIPSYTDQTGALENVDVRVQVQQISGSTTQLYGIGFGAPFQFQRFGIESAGKWSVLTCKGTTCTSIVDLTTSPAIHTGLGTTNTLEVRVARFHFDFFVNGTKVGQADKSDYVGGHLAFDGANGIEVVFSNVTISTAY
jgi:hypothetical protein